jgi:hypothetical protein
MYEDNHIMMKLEIRVRDNKIILADIAKIYYDISMINTISTLLAENNKNCEKNLKVILGEMLDTLEREAKEYLQITEGK